MGTTELRAATNVDAGMPVDLGCSNGLGFLLRERRRLQRRMLTGARSVDILHDFQAQRGTERMRPGSRAMTMSGR